MKKPRGIDGDVEDIRARLAALVDRSAGSVLSDYARKRLERDLRALILEFEQALQKIDPIALPASVFDPSNPKIVGRFTALALLAQERRALREVGRFYGSGVYAIYYRGTFAPYVPLSTTETPIYVGKAGPATQGARSPIEQGERLAARLNEHRKNIEKASTTLDIGEFEARFLVVQSGWEGTAEGYLIHLFRPIWNSETDILYGLGKHGDDPKTRANRRSPWDTLHPGRQWAVDTTEDARSPQRIAEDLEAHFRDHPPVADRTALLDTFFRELQQHEAQ